MGNVLNGTNADCCTSLLLNPLGFEEDEVAPKLMLTVAYTPIEPSLGANLLKLETGAKVIVLDISKPDSIDTLRWRYMKEHHEVPGPDGQELVWPMTHRFQVRRRSFRVKIADEKGGVTDCILQISKDPSSRTAENLQKDVEDSKQVASYAHKFNMQQLGSLEMDGGEGLCAVKVAAPIGCQVVAKSKFLMEPINQGDLLTLAPFPDETIEKFVFEGDEKFHELPQAFFHYVAWLSGGKEMACDLQGSLGDEGELTLVDPVVVRTGGASILEHITCQPPQGNTPLPPLFDKLHPRCAQMCKDFDKSRAVRSKRLGCGMPSCNGR